MNWVDPWGLQTANTIEYDCSYDYWRQGEDGSMVGVKVVRTCTIELRQVNWNMPGSWLPGHVFGMPATVYLAPDAQCQLWMIGDAIGEAGALGQRGALSLTIVRLAVGESVSRSNTPRFGLVGLLVEGKDVITASIGVSQVFQWVGAALQAMAGDAAPAAGQGAAGIVPNQNPAGSLGGGNYKIL